MEYTGFIALAALLIGINELREWRSNEKHQDILEEIEINNKKVENLHDRVLDLKVTMLEAIENIAVQMGMISDLQQSMKESIEASKISHEFINKSTVDLATIVNEYKINGIPLGYQRKPHMDNFDLVEGL